MICFLLTAYIQVLLENISKSESLKQWYLNYISYFREEYEKLSTDEKTGIGNTNNFLKPCQIEIFWITNPDFQLIVQSNFSDRTDKEIIVNGPHEPYEFRSNAVTVLKNKRWAWSSAQNSMSGYKQVDTLGERMAMEIYRVSEMVKSSVFELQRTYPIALFGIAVENTWACTYMGNIGDLDYIQEVNKIIQGIKQDAKIKHGKKPILQQPAQPTGDKYAGFGIHFFPPIIVGSERKRTIEELIYNAPKPWMRNSKVFDMKIVDSQIIVNGDGFIFVETKSKDHALKILNLIMACGAFYGLSLHAVREHELVMVDYDKTNLTLTGMQWNSETRRSPLLEDHFNPTSITLARTSVNPETIQEALVNTGKLLEHEKLAEDMRLLNEGLTHFENSEFAPAFIMGWSVIERHYSDLWNKLLFQKNIDHERLSKLTNSSQWTIDYVLESLSLQDKIDENSYDLLMDLKRKRNKFYHNGKQIMRDDADRCLKYAMGLLGEKIKPHIRISNNLILSGQQSMKV